jgi:hypothetical protein
MAGAFTVFAIQPLGTTVQNGVVPRNQVPEAVRNRFLNQSFCRSDLEAMGVRWCDVYALYSDEGGNYVLNLTTERWAQ